MERKSLNIDWRCNRWEHKVSRRQWLGLACGVAAGASGIGGVESLLGQVPEATTPQNNKQVLFIWIDGGMSQFESWDPKPGTRFGGPFRAIDTSLPGITISELMPRTATHMHQLAVVRSMCTQDNSHSAGVPRIQRGDPKNRGVIYPFFGSAVARLMGPGASELPPYVVIKPGNGGFLHQDAGFLGPQYGALAFGDGRPPENLPRHESVTDEDDQARNRLRQLANERYARRRRKTNVEADTFVFDAARRLMERRELFDSTMLDPLDVERYGTHELGRHLLQARGMLEAGVRFVKVTSYGWDTHGDNFIGHRSLMPRFDQAFAAIVGDLAQRGMLDRVLVIALSEFGRTPRINGHVGRDHWPECWSLAMTGAGIKRGVVVGQTNAEGTWVEGQGYDIGHMFHTWFAALGIDSQTTRYDNHGQPLPLAHDDCGPVKEVLA